MNKLEQKILDEGKILNGNILKVDNFLNHQVDPELMMYIGNKFFEYFKNRGITKVLTLEVSGISMALTTAHFLQVPMVFAKKIESRTLSDDVYESKVISFTKKKEYIIRVDKQYLNSNDKVLIIDDFLANGKALNGLIDLCYQAKSEIIGIGIAIEKSFQIGGKKARQNGYDVYSIAKVKKLEDGKIEFEY